MSLTSTLIKATKVDDVNAIVNESTIEQITLPEYIYINPNAYACEGSEVLIAMETAEALHDVFLESFYAGNQIELLAVREGVDVEESKYSHIMESIMVNAVDKLKKILKTLREKAKAFFNGIMKMIDSVSKSASDFFKKYDAQLQSLVGLTGFTFNMYDYNDSLFGDAEEIATYCTNKNIDYLLEKLEIMIRIMDENDPNINKQYDPNINSYEEFDRLYDEIEKITVPSVIYAIFSSSPDNIVQQATSSDYRKYAFGLFRNGATSPNDKKDVEIVDVYAKIQTLKDFKADDVKKVRQSCDKSYNEVIGMLNESSSEWFISENRPKNSDRLVAAMNNVVTALATIQNINNIFISEWGKAIKERDKAYKQMAMAAFSYAKKMNKIK